MDLTIKHINAISPNQLRCIQLKETISLGNFGRFKDAFVDTVSLKALSFNA